MFANKESTKMFKYLVILLTVLMNLGVVCRGDENSLQQSQLTPFPVRLAAQPDRRATFAAFSVPDSPPLTFGPLATKSDGSFYSPIEAAKTGPEFGTIATLPDGRIFTWFAQGKNYTKALKDTTIVDDLDTPQYAFGRWSNDAGRTWSTKPTQLFEFPRERGVRVAGTTLCDSKGVLHIFGLNYIRFDWKDYNPDKFNYEVWQAVSRDGGATWSPVERINYGHTTFGWMNSVIELRNGRILMPLAYLSKNQTARNVCSAIYSDDGGQNWQHSQSILSVNSGGSNLESGACEPVAVELGDGRVWMVIRTQTGYSYESFSSDGGKTWTEPVQSRFVSTNSPAQLLRLRNNRIVIAWNNCTFGKLPDFRGDRCVMSVAASDDDGKTWQGYREIFRRVTTGIIAYPFMTEAQDGTVLIYLWGGGGHTVRLRPDWLAETSLVDDFSGGMAEWATMGAAGVRVEPDPANQGRNVLVLKKPNPKKEAAAIRNFPYAKRGRLTIHLRTMPGFKGASLCLNDYFSLPPIKQTGRFGVALTSDGWLWAIQGNGEEIKVAQITAGKRLAFTFAWDCAKRQCTLLLDDKPVAELWSLLAPDLAQLPPTLAGGQRIPEAEGLCYLRIALTGKTTDPAGLVVEKVDMRAMP